MRVRAGDQVVGPLVDHPVPDKDTPVVPGEPVVQYGREVDQVLAHPGHSHELVQNDRIAVVIDTGRDKEAVLLATKEKRDVARVGTGGAGEGIGEFQVHGVDFPVPGLIRSHLRGAVGELQRQV